MSKVSNHAKEKEVLIVPYTVVQITGINLVDASAGMIEISADVAIDSMEADEDNVLETIVA